MAEELLVNDAHDAPIPMDYKFWCFGERIAHVTIMTGRHRNEAGTQGYGVTYADCDADYVEAATWCAAAGDAETGSRQVKLPPLPKCWDDMVGTVRRLGAAAGVFTRVDMYATTRGPIFGEFQCLFNLRDWNGECDAAIRAHWRGWDGGGGAR